ncbi:hypothetical protein [Bradyrhizobium sp. Ghvi]|uniref:hypothetical protein n=1 Tax=Bradyrhizobium sp. Ghvi TaxID=1855319 RepID=UPI0011785A18|nr:hypothetical protein [Bradyrhizobium sp. Ghvi]
MDNHDQFPDVFTDAGNGFVGMPFCFVAGTGTKQIGLIGRGLAESRQETALEPARLARPGRAG